MLDPFALADPSAETDARRRFDRVERFLATVLAPHRIGTDGVVSCRLITQTESRVFVAGAAYWIDQSLHTFALEVRIDDARVDRLHWTLYVDPVVRSERAARHVVDLVNDPADYDWERSFTGRASRDERGDLIESAESV